MHFETNVYPIYTKEACDGLEKLGLPTPYLPNDIASYGLYVQRLEGLKIHAPAEGMPEIGLPKPAFCNSAWSDLDKNVSTHLKLLAVAIIWGLGWVAGRVAALEIPFTAGWVRYIIAVVCLVFLKVTKQWILLKDQWKIITAIGSVNLSLSGIFHVWNEMDCCRRCFVDDNFQSSVYGDSSSTISWRKIRF